MLPCNIGGHAAYQNFVLTEIFHFYPDPFSLSKDTWETIIEFWHLDLSLINTNINKFKIDQLPKIISYKQEWNWKDLIIYREFTIDFFQLDLNSLPKNASSLRKTKQALKDLYGIDISHQSIANYALFLPSGEDGFGQSP